MILTPPNTIPVISDLWVFLSIDARGNEGVCGAHTPLGWTPLVTADPKLLDQLRPMAREIAQRTGLRVRMVRFTQRVEEALDG